MEVILLDKIAHLGGLGDKVKVRNGFARNFLLPQKKAVLANKENLAKFEAQRAELEARIAAELSAATERANAIAAIGKFTIAALAGDEGKLFGSIGTRDIADAVTAAVLRSTSLKFVYLRVFYVLLVSMLSPYSYTRMLRSTSL